MLFHCFRGRPPLRLLLWRSHGAATGASQSSAVGIWVRPGQRLCRFTRSKSLPQSRCACAKWWAACVCLRKGKLTFIADFASLAPKTWMSSQDKLGSVCKPLWKEFDDKRSSRASPRFQYIWGWARKGRSMRFTFTGYISVMFIIQAGIICIQRRLVEVGEVVPPLFFEREGRSNYETSHYIFFPFLNLFVILKKHFSLFFGKKSML